LVEFGICKFLVSGAVDRRVAAVAQALAGEAAGVVG
jgi:hypothetical protein